MADNIADGGPAFPHLRPLARWTEDGPEMVKENMGMSLRDWFAGQLISSWFAGVPPNALGDLGQEGQMSREPFRIIARASYRLADAMLEAREKS